MLTRQQVTLAGVAHLNGFEGSWTQLNAILAAHNYQRILYSDFLIGPARGQTCFRWGVNVSFVFRESRDLPPGNVTALKTGRSALASHEVYQFTVYSLLS